MERAYFQLALSMCLVGINIAVGKIISQTIPVFIFANIRFIIATAVLMPLILYRSNVSLLPPKLDWKYLLQEFFGAPVSKKDWKYLFLQAFFGVFLFSIFMLYGVRYTSAISSGIITSSTPAWIAIIAFVFLRERMNKYNASSILLAVLGILLISITYTGGTPMDSSKLLGNSLIICAVISEALFTIFAKSTSSHLGALQMTAIINFFGFLLFIPFSLQTLATIEIHISWSIWILIIYYSLTASVFSFLLWFRGITKVPANISGLFTVFMPISSALTGMIFLNESITLQQIIGMILATMAIAIGLYSQTKSNSSDSPIVAQKHK